MPLDASLLQNLKPVQAPDLLGPFQTMSQLKTMQLQQQDIGQQIEQRRQEAQQKEIANKKAVQLAQLYQDAAVSGEDTTTPAFSAKVRGIDPNFGEAHDTHVANLKKTEQETATSRTQQQKAQFELENPKPEGGFKYNFASKSWEPVTTPTQQSEIDLRTEQARREKAEAIKAEMETGNFPQTIDDAERRLDAIAPPTDKDLGQVNQRFKGQLNAQQYNPAYGASVLKDAMKQSDGIAQARATVPFKIDVQQAGAGNLQGNGLDLAAEQYINTGQTPGRNPVMAAKIIQRASEMLKERGMTNQAALEARNAAQANKQALDVLTKQSAQVEAFSQTAEKNMQVLEGAMKQVTDLGAPFLNTPVRSLQAKYAGNPKVTAFSAAIVPVQTEIAKILNSTNATGMLTDTARSEMERALSPGARPAQLKAALDVFRKDIQNRKETYAAQLQDLQQKSVVGGTSNKSADPLGIR